MLDSACVVAGAGTLKPNRNKMARNDLLQASQCRRFS
jgi:hypothetical protein